MQLQIFSIPTIGGEKTNEEMNKFLRSCKLIDIDKQLVTNDKLKSELKREGIISQKKQLEDDMI